MTSFRQYWRARSGGDRDRPHDAPPTIATHRSAARGAAGGITQLRRYRVGGEAGLRAASAPIDQWASGSRGASRGEHSRLRTDNHPRSTPHQDRSGRARTHNGSRRSASARTRRTGLSNIPPVACNDCTKGRRRSPSRPDHGRSATAGQMQLRSPRRHYELAQPTE